MPGISWPQDILANFPGWATEFDLVYRQEASRQASGFPIVKDLGTPVWRGAWQTTVLRPHALAHWKARLNSVQNGAGTFYGYDMRKYPAAHSNGVGLPGAVTVHSVSEDRGVIQFSGASGLQLNAGDQFSINNNLYQAMEASTNGGAFGIMPYALLDVEASDSVLLTNPRCIMRVMPGSVRAEADVSTGRGVLTFEAFQEPQGAA